MACAVLWGWDSGLVLFSLEPIAFNPGAQLPQRGVIHLRQMIGSLLHDQLQVVWIVDGLIRAHQHIFDAEQSPGLRFPQPRVRCQDPFNPIARRVLSLAIHRNVLVPEPLSRLLASLVCLQRKEQRARIAVTLR